MLLSKLESGWMGMDVDALICTGVPWSLGGHGKKTTIVWVRRGLRVKLRSTNATHSAVGGSTEPPTPVAASCLRVLYLPAATHLQACCDNNAVVGSSDADKRSTPIVGPATCSKHQQLASTSAYYLCLSHWE